MNGTDIIPSAQATVTTGPIGEYDPNDPFVAIEDAPNNNSSDSKVMQTDLFCSMW